MFQFARIPSVFARFDALSKFFWLFCVAILVFVDDLGDRGKHIVVPVGHYDMPGANV